MKYNAQQPRKRLPPFGGELAERLKFANTPLWVIVFCGQNAWARAKDPRARIGDCHPLVWDGKEYRWPVANCYVLVEIGAGPSLKQIRALARELLLAGAAGVLDWWLSWGESRPIAYQSDGKARYLSAKEIESTMHGEVRHAA